MRALLIILALLGAAVVGLAIAVGGGWLRLPSPDRLTPPRIASSNSSSTRPTSPEGDGEVDTLDDASDTAPPINPGHPGEANGAAPQVPEQLADRAILLRADQARLTGPGLRLGGTPVTPDSPATGRLRPLGQCITAWTDASTTAQWSFTVPEAGRYSVTLDYSTGSMEKGGKGLGGPFVLTIGDERIAGQITPTRSARSFELVDVGMVQVPKGDTRLTFRPDAKVKPGFLNLRSVRLFAAE